MLNKDSLLFIFHEMLNLNWPNSFKLQLTDTSKTQMKLLNLRKALVLSMFLFSFQISFYQMYRI